MQKVELPVGTRVYQPRKGYGVVVDPRPELRCYVGVAWDRTGMTENADVEGLKFYASRAVDHRWIRLIKDQPLSYRLVGFILSRSHHLYLSVPEDKQDRVLDQLLELGVENVELMTLSSHGAMGELFILEFERCPWEKEYEGLTGVIFHPVTKSPKHCQIGSTVFIRDFLMRELGFQLGGTEPGRVVARVPEPFMPDFRAGADYGRR